MLTLEYLESLLATNVRILHENDTHAVVAITVEKARVQDFLLRNPLFGAAVLDLKPSLVPGKEPI